MIKLDRHIRRARHRLYRLSKASACWLYASIKKPDNLPAFLTALFTLLLAAFAFAAWIEATHGTRAMQGQLDAMKADQRPWVKIEQLEPSSIPGEPQFDGLRFLTTDAAGFLPLHFVVKNVGRSPAFNVQVGVWPFYGYAQRELDLPNEERKNCEGLGKNLLTMPMATDATNYIRVLFPQDMASFDNATLGLMPDQVKKFSYGDDPAKKVFQLWFYGCILYSLPGSDKVHQTGFAYRVSHKVQAIGTPVGVAQDVTFAPWVSIPADQLVLNPTPTAAGDTN